MKRIDLTGKRFSYLVVVEYAGTDKRGQATWLCRCDCGNTKAVRASKLKEGDVTSCGCMHHAGKHGLTYTRLYNIWQTMKARCMVKSSQKYYAYGGRGIKVCEEWQHDFKAFYDWAMANGYSDSLSIDRIDNNGDYCPENCRWATAKEQAYNRRNTIWIEFNGEKHTISEWCEIAGITKSALTHRIYRGWSIERALSTPMQNKVKGE